MMDLKQWSIFQKLAVFANAYILERLLLKERILSHLNVTSDWVDRYGSASYPCTAPRAFFQ